MPLGEMAARDNALARGIDELAAVVSAAARKLNKDTARGSEAYVRHNALRSCRLWLEDSWVLCCKLEVMACVGVRLQGSQLGFSWELPWLGIS